MSLRNGTILLFAVVLTACGGGGGGGSADGPSPNQPPKAGTADLYYTYPADHQMDVAPRSPLVLGFMSKVSVGASNFTLKGPDGEVATTAKTVNNGKGIVLTPKQPLALKSQYTLTVSGLKSAGGGALFPDGNLQFTTRPALAGAPIDLQRTSPTFEVSSMSPDGTDLPFLDFSSVNLTLTQPIDPQTAVYGDTVVIKKGKKVVPATLLVDGNSMTIDPVNAAPDPDDGVKNNHDLTPDEPLTVTLTGGVKNRQGDALAVFSKTVTPRDTTPRSTLVQRAAPANESGTCLSRNVTTSPLTGDAINCVPVIARLLGDTTVSKQQGNVYAQLAFAPHFPDITPLRIPKGSLLKGDPLKVLIGGKVDTGFDSGKVTVTFLSDANGYLMPNPYTDNPEAPRRLVLTMDVAFNTEDPRANGAFNQNLLHVKLVGTAITDVDKGSLIVNAIGVVEPRVLGSEDAYGVLSFHMESLLDQKDAPAQPEDHDRPTLASWMPDDNVDKQRPGDPIILSFSEPLDNKSIKAGTSLTLTDQTSGQNVPFDWYQDGVDVVIKPKEPLGYNDIYQVAYTDTITDFAGNGAQPKTLRFTMPTYSGDGHQPIATTVYPGFPCATDKTTWDIGAGDQGICRGGESDDDHLPVMPMPANRPIQVQFSQVMDKASIQVGTTCNTGSFRVEKLATDGSGKPAYTTEGSKKKYQCADAVPGQLSYQGRSVTFTPDEPWQEGAYYRYVLMSENQGFTPADCSNGEALCSLPGDLPLQTAVLEAPGENQGGPDMEIYFKGAATSGDVFQGLRNLPAYDVNADFVHQDSEPQPRQDPNDASQYLVPPNSTKLGVTGHGGLLLNANVGCEIGASCPDKKFIYLTGALDTQIVGYDPDAGAVKVDIYPTLLETSTVDVYAKLLLVVIPVNQTIATGPQIMRIRYQKDADGNRTQPVTGWIRQGPDGPVFETTLELYLSAPYLHPQALGITLSHDLYSYPLTLELSGPVTFLDDGRLQIKQLNAQAHDIKVNISLDDGGVLKAASMTLGIPEKGVNLNYVSTPIKH